MNRVLLPLFIGLVLVASSFAAGVQNITIDANGNVLNSTATNYATGQLKVNGVAVGGGGGGGSGTVTSIGISGANGIAVSGTPITTAGTIALSLPITLAGTTGKTFTLSNSLTLAGTDGSTLNIGSGGTLDTAAYTASSAYATSGQGTKADNAGAVNGIVKSNGSAVFSAVTDNSSNWDTAYTDRLKWDGGATGLVAATGRTSLGATTVGSNIFSLTNPSAITFLQINADNTVTAQSASAQRTALGLVIGTNVEAWDADLDALAALTGTNTIYYRSAANTWSAVTIGTNLSFSSGTLSATGGGTPGGSNTQLQYNNSGAFGGITNATTDGTTVTLTAPTISTINSAAGTTLNLNGTISAAGVSSIAGTAAAVTASNAIAGTTNAGAAAGGSVTVTAGNAARLTSGNANGGNISLTTGSGIGTGTVGDVLIPNGTIVGQAGTNGLTLSNSGSGDRVALNGSTYIEFKIAGTQQGYFTGGVGGFNLGTGVRWINDNSYDIGTATVRLRDIYVGRSILATSGAATDTGQSRNAAGIWEDNSGTAGKFGQRKAGTIALQSLATPAASPSAAVVGTAGSTTISYSYTDCQADGSCTAASPVVTVTTANATLTSSNKITLTFPALGTNTTYRNVYRTATNGTSPTTTGKINSSTVTTTTFDDTGLAGDASTAPTANKTGSATVPGGVIGTTTNDNAQPGAVGEYVTATLPSASLITLTTATAANVTSISLTAGDWDVEGMIDYQFNNTTVVSYMLSGSSNTSATLSTEESFLDWEIPFTASAIGTTSFNIPARRYSLSSTTTIYLVAKAAFTTSTLKAFGIIRARRVR